MSQINFQSGQLVAEPESKQEPRRAISKGMPQVRRDFDAALRRAGQHETDSEGTDQPDQLDQSEQTRANSLTALGAVVPMPPGTAAKQMSFADGMPGGVAMTALPNTPCGTLPDAVPMNAGAMSTNAADQQWRVNIPVNDPSSSALAMRLVNVGAGHWQVRLAADGPTRLQLTPHLDRLRDKLRQRSGDRIDDLGFDDDMDPRADGAT
jgi:hypothetical protein